MKEIPDEIFYQMVDLTLSDPVPLKDADLNHPFIYDREYGVFYVSSGMHVVAMANILAWRKGANNVRALLKANHELQAEVKEKTYSSSDKYQLLADHYLLNMKGTAMGSSISNFILIGKLSNLNEQEKIILGRHEIRELNQ